MSHTRLCQPRLYLEISNVLDACEVRVDGDDHEVATLGDGRDPQVVFTHSHRHQGCPSALGPFLGAEAVDQGGFERAIPSGPAAESAGWTGRLESNDSTRAIFAVRRSDFAAIKISSPRTMTQVATSTSPRVARRDVSYGSRSSSRLRWFVSSRYISLRPGSGSRRPQRCVRADRCPPTTRQR